MAGFVGSMGSVSRLLHILTMLLSGMDLLKIRMKDFTLYSDLDWIFSSLFSIFELDGKVWLSTKVWNRVSQ